MLASPGNYGLPVVVGINDHRVQCVQRGASSGRAESPCQGNNCVHYLCRLLAPGLSGTDHHDWVLGVHAGLLAVSVLGAET